MNIFRFIADMLHLAAILILLYRIKNTRNCVGISCKTHEIYMVVFCMRYLDLFMYFVSLYNTTMKIFFIASTAFIIFLMRVKKPFCSTYDSLGDSFKHWQYLLPAAFVLTLICHRDDEWWDYVLSFSWWLEALAFIPQIAMLNRIRVIENMTSNYVACLGLYRFFYILNW